MNLHRILVAIAVGSLLTASASACGQGNGKAEPSGTSKPAATNGNAAAGATAFVAATSASLPAATEAPAALKTVNASNLLGVVDLGADLPGNYASLDLSQLSTPVPGSVFADPSAYSACRSGPGRSLDIGFGVFDESERRIRDPFIGETLVAYPSVDAADKAMGDAASRAELCTENDKSGSTTSIVVSAQSVPDDLGDAVRGFKMVLGFQTGPAGIGYVILIRRTNVVVTIFYFSSSGSDKIDQLIKVARSAANKVG